MKTLTHNKESFDALLDLLIANGNELIGERWRCDKEGFHSCLKRPIDWNLVYSSFAIDSNAILVYENAIATISEAYEISCRP